MKNDHHECKVLLTHMLDLQKKLNTTIDPHWQKADQKYYRAIWIECAELTNYLNWKWWRYGKLNIKQIHLELIDIFHFGLCDILTRWPEKKTLPEEVITAMSELLNKNKLIEPEIIFSCLEDFVSYSLETKQFNIIKFANLVKHCGMSLHELFQLYVGKNILNRLRQEEGYKRGTYQKIWGTREDNEWLVELQAKIPFSMERYSSDIYLALSSIYDEFFHHKFEK
ncbi:dUTP diphosphatase [Xenorhabdus sp. 18]|uniref:dUTP diphosphatase n=1 Tax=Xenorhabdus doucetiae TaxID=351671 RepID=UPI001996C81C|nr:dUTP diphosphatase [Xenorhabdus sp. 18]MBD2796396.1 dUTP diphosphatase [Xenorhabdus sp. 18]